VLRLIPALLLAILFATHAAQADDGGGLPVGVEGRWADAQEMLCGLPDRQLSAIRKAPRRVAARAADLIHGFGDGGKLGDAGSDRLTAVARAQVHAYEMGRESDAMADLRRSQAQAQAREMRLFRSTNPDDRGGVALDETVGGAAWFTAAASRPVSQDRPQTDAPYRRPGARRGAPEPRTGCPAPRGRCGGPRAM